MPVPNVWISVVQVIAFSLRGNAALASVRHETLGRLVGGRSPISASHQIGVIDSKRGKNMNSALKHTLIAMATAALGMATTGCNKDAEAPEASEATSGAEEAKEASCGAEGKCGEGKCGGDKTKGAAEASCGEGSCG